MPPRDDPRTIITPDAFQVASHLLGVPTAPPWRRLAAMLVDLTVIALLSHTPGFVLALAVGIVLFRVALGRGGDPIRRWVRGTLGCLGVAALSIGLLVVWLARTGGPRLEVPVEVAGGQTRTPTLRLSDLAVGLGDLGALAEAPTDSAARVAADRLVRWAQAAGVGPQELRSVLEGELDESERAGRAMLAAIAEAVAAEEGQEGASLASEADAAPADSLALLWLQARARGDSLAAEEARRRLVPLVAGPELAAREGRIETLERETRGLREREERLEEELEEALEDPGLLPLLEGVADDLGLGLGWSGLYFTVFLVAWRGRTPGKRLLGIRVVKLDGTLMGWWNSFERFGGYGASIFTGLLGFAEMLWDRNRQALHDRIARTVVVRDAGLRLSSEATRR